MLFRKRECRQERNRLRYAPYHMPFRFLLSLRLLQISRILCLCVLRPAQRIRKYPPHPAAEDLACLCHLVSDLTALSAARRLPV